MPVKLLIFDLDGTLIDTSRDITNALNYALSSQGFKSLSVEDTIKMIGEGITRLIEKTLGHDRLHERDAVIKKFLDYYSEHLTDYSTVYPYVRETLAQLDGYKKAVISNKRENLSGMAASLNERYFDNALKISSIEYVTDQRSKFGCCNYTTASIRISHRVSTMPAWVQEYVVLHEMGHLIEPNHSRSFWKIVSRYTLAERARGYLIALGLETPLE